MQLENAIVIRIKTSGFDLDKIAHSGHCFRWVEIGPSKYLVIDGRRQALLEKNRAERLGRLERLGRQDFLRRYARTSRALVPIPRSANRL